MGTFLPDFIELQELRKELHQFPELSGKEFNTAERIVSFLQKYPPDELVTTVGKTGILATYSGEVLGQTVLFRCELDALPINEINIFNYRSETEGISHKCGHDGHMAILCGLAKQLYLNKPKKGKVVLLFQPAEEDGSGAKKVANDIRFQQVKPDYAFALHNLPGYSKSQIVIKEGTFTCAVNSIIIKLKGITSHAGEPEKGINPALAMAEITTEFLQLTQPLMAQDNFCIVTPIYTAMGKKAYGVSAGEGEIHFTVRSNSNKQMRIIEAKFENFVAEKAAKYHLAHTIKWTQSFQANENSKDAVALIENAALISDYSILKKKHPFTWGEDFGLFTQLYSGAMFGLGSGEDTPALHNPDYDFPDEIITTGVTMFHEISKKITNAQ
ncbi:amidohydrolase [Flavobacterium sp. TAB 87]|uniref:amidohydrolase n=1 Tax=Flavobacterium sp. TAB 87 TaxID=1729581 RepID=UPI00076C0F7E|nr:amidohydrolase [Flavobacterium sp. TAB 87]KVV14878.1 N-acetyldiaminopimelate deacetylase [Flavobacterium sp. TAB 87]